ncbi:MAG: M56 family metallopeptidase [Limisphaerales bacterium]
MGGAGLGPCLADALAVQPAHRAFVCAGFCPAPQASRLRAVRALAGGARQTGVAAPAGAAQRPGLVAASPRRSRPPSPANSLSPAVCGLFAPVILLPRALAEQLAPDQLRAVLLHELFHLRRGDLWLGFVQALFQTLYWWHPLLWPANARIRRAREDAVDDAVMLALGGGAEAYPPTLLQVARLALSRPAGQPGSGRHP